MVKAVTSNKRVSCFGPGAQCPPCFSAFVARPSTPRPRYQGQVPKGGTSVAENRRCCENHGTFLVDQATLDGG